MGLQPSCVVVCPEQAIIAGDMDDPDSEIARLLDRHPVQVRKPEKGTRPKLYYIEADEAALVPTRTATDERFMWSRGDSAPAHGPAAEPAKRVPRLTVARDPSPRRVYDVRPRPPAWGWEVAAYTWTKSIAAGAFLAVPAAKLLAGPVSAARLAVGMGFVALLFLALSAGLLV